MTSTTPNRIRHMFDGRVEGRGNNVAGTEDVVEKGEGTNI
jgi:hypothetical protein